MVCLNFKTAKLSSIDVSVSLVCKSSSKISAISSPLLCMSDFCCALSCIDDNSLTLLDSSRIFEKVSIIEIVAWVACELLSIVASMYRPFSEKALGFTVECLSFSNRWKFSTSSNFSDFVSSTMNPAGNLSGLLATALLMSLVSTP